VVCALFHLERKHSTKHIAKSTLYLNLIVTFENLHERCVRVGGLHDVFWAVSKACCSACTAQWSLYVPHSGHYMYSTVVTLRTAQWSLYVPHSGHYMYRTVVTIRTARFNIHKSYVLPTHCICVLCVSENKQRLFPYTALTDWFYYRDGVYLLRGTDWIFNTLRTGLLNCLNARSRGLTFRHRASCI